MSRYHDEPSERELLLDTVRYWEQRRIVFNIAVFVVLFVAFLSHLPRSREAFDANTWLALLVVTVLVNLAYCAAYVLEIIARHSELREAWERVRFIAWCAGTALTCFIVHFVAKGFFALPALPGR